MDAYLSLRCFPEVREAGGETGQTPARPPLERLTQVAGAPIATSGLGAALKHVLWVDAVKVYKPSPLAYALAPRALGLSADALLFVSSNAWAVAGTKAFGFSSLVLGAPEEAPGLPADLVVTGLDHLPL